ncbi:tyrosine-type recombinase/integrase [Nonomuraea sp. NPDC002799]
MELFYAQAGRLLDIPDAGQDGHEARMEILEMVRAAHRKQAPLPEVEEIHRKYRAGQPLQSMMFGEYWTTWRARRARLKDIRESTLLTYTSHWDVHIREVLEEVRMDRLFAPTVERVFSRIDEKNAELLAARASDDPEVRRSVRGKRPTGPVSKQRVLATIRTVLSAAEREHLVTFNAAKLVKLDAGKKTRGVVWITPRVEAFSAAYEQRLLAERAASTGKPPERFKVWLSTPRPSPVMVWTPAHLGVFLDFAVQDRLYALYHLIAFRGLRRGEACGTRWVDADLDQGLLGVVKQLVVVGKQVKEGDLKTESSEAAVALDTGTVAVLRTHHHLQKQERLAWGAAWTDSGRIFTQEDGSPLKPDWVSEHFERMAFAAGLPPIRLHDLRHGAATLSLAAGNDLKVTSAMLRHSSLRITGDLYVSILPEVAHAAAEATAALVPRGVGTRGPSQTGGLPSVSHLAQRRPTDSERSREAQVEQHGEGESG